MPGIFGRIGAGLDSVAEPLGRSVNRLRLGSVRAGYASSRAVSAGGGIGSLIASTARASARPQNIRTGRTVIGARSSFKWDWLR